MNKQTIIPLVLLAVGAFASCKKDDSPGVSAATCTITINDTLNITPDSVHYDYYSGTLPRMQAFKNSEAVFTLWPGSFATNTVSLKRQYVYWIYKTGIYSPEEARPGSLTLTNSNDVLSGSFTANGTVYSGTGPAAGKISATFANVRQTGR